MTQQLGQDPAEERLREAMAELRRRDEQEAPSFERTMRGAERKAFARRQSWGVVVAAGVAGLAVASIVATLVPRPEPAPTPVIAVRLAHPEPLAFLLAFPGASVATSTGRWLP